MHEFPLVEVAGSSYEMGRQHGAQASPLIQKYILWIEKSTGKTRDEVIEEIDVWIEENEDD